MTTGAIITKAELPRDLPGPSEERFLVIVCEPDGIKWSLHDGVSFHYAPTVFWTTPHLQDEDRSASPCKSLTRFLCQHALAHIFGASDYHKATKQNATKTAAKRMAPSTTIYVLSSNKQHETDLLFLFSEVPSRILRFSASDFFDAQALSSVKATIGQLAAMHAIKKDYGSPVLLMECSVAIEYFGLDGNSKFLGGGVCAGMPIRCRSLFDYCNNQDFPSIDFERYTKLTEKAKKSGTPMSLFSTDPFQRVAASATAEMAGQLRNIVKQFLGLVGPTDAPVTVVLCGDDTHLTRELLTDNCSSIVAVEPDVEFPGPSKVTFVVRKNMAAYGVQHLLSASKEQKVPLDADDELREDLVGLRAAYIKEPGNTKIHRGSITRVVRGAMFEEDSVILLLDEGDNVTLDLIKLYDCLSLYQEVGEESKIENKEVWVGEKQQASTKVQVELEKKNEVFATRKTILSEAKEKEGSIVKMVAPPENDKRGAKRPRQSPSPKPKKASKESPEKYVGHRIAKLFDSPNPDDEGDMVLYFGSIDKYNGETKLWHVTYDDDDEEEFDFDEVRDGILLWAKNKDDDKNAKS